MDVPIWVWWVTLGVTAVVLLFDVVIIGRRPHEPSKGELIGALGTQQPEPGAYALGAASASALWFFGLALGAAWLAPLLARPATWRLLDLGVALMMFAVAWQLLQGA